MATKLLIVYPIRDSRSIPAMGRYRHSQKHDSHIWDGREYDTSSKEDMDAFNQDIHPALAMFTDRLPQCIVRTVYEAPSIVDVPVADEEEHESHLQVPLAPPRKRHAKLKRGFAIAD